MAYQSIVRDGNHFIYLDGAGWILIDGPWFKSLPLDRLRIMLPGWLPPRLIPHDFDNSGPPIFISAKEITWERISWVSSWPKMTKAMKSIPSRLSFLHKFRRKWGWRIGPDGQLPVKFNAIEWHPDMHWY